MLADEENCSFKANLIFYSLYYIKLVMIFNRLPEIPLVLNLHKKPFYHTLSNALDISKSTSQTARILRNNLHILLVIDRSWLNT